MVDFGQTFGAGVACGKVDKAVWLGKQAGGWIFGSNGSAVAGANIRFSLNHKFFDRDGPYKAKGCDGPSNAKGVKFNAGDVLTLRLDLSDASAGGTFSINGKQVVAKMRAEITKHPLCQQSPYPSGLSGLSTSSRHRESRR
eukprot:342761-Rhodomonas_salina.2